MTDVVDLVRNLVRIDSSNPALVDEGVGESEIAGFAADWLTERGFAVELVGRDPDRPSLIAVHPGSGGGRSLLLNGHLDTVSLSSFAGAALDPVVSEGRLHGRGTYDMKGGIGAIMVAAAEASRTPHRGDIVLTLVADEEHGSTGTEDVLQYVTADAAIVAEPTNEDLVTAHRGFVWIEATVHGVAAHGSRRDLGVDAIAHGGSLLTAVAHLDHALAALPAHPLLGTANVHASRIRGGEELSSYPAECVIELERRTLPGEDGSSVLAELEQLISEVAAAQPGFHATCRILLERPPFAIASDAPVVTTLQGAIQSEYSSRAVERGEAFWTDCALITEAGIPAVLFGPVGAGAHAADEWIDIASLRRVTAVLTRTITTFTA